MGHGLTRASPHEGSGAVSVGRVTSPASCCHSRFKTSAVEVQQHSSLPSHHYCQLQSAKPSTLAHASEDDSALTFVCQLPSLLERLPGRSAGTVRRTPSRWCSSCSCIVACKHTASSYFSCMDIVPDSLCIYQGLREWQVMTAGALCLRRARSAHFCAQCVFERRLREASDGRLQTQKARVTPSCITA